MIFEEHKSKTCDSRPSYIVIGVRDSDLQQLSDGLIVACSCICETDGVHTTVSENGVLIRIKLALTPSCGISYLTLSASN